MKIDKKKLEIAMARAKMNRVMLAKKAGMPLPTVCNVCSRGACLPYTLGRLADALGIDVTELIEN